MINVSINIKPVALYILFGYLFSRDITSFAIFDIAKRKQNGAIKTLIDAIQILCHRTIFFLHLSFHAENLTTEFFDKQTKPISKNWYNSSMFAMEMLH